MKIFKDEAKKMNKEVDGQRYKHISWDQSEYVEYKSKEDRWVMNNSKDFSAEIEIFDEFVEINNDFKIIKWYKPDIIWLTNKDKPEDYKGDYYSSKDLLNWFSKPEEVKVIRWIEIDACDNWGKLESN